MLLVLLNTAKLSENLGNTLEELQSRKALSPKGSLL